MYFFYTLQLNNGKLYDGYTNNLRKRISDHKSKRSDFTARYKSFRLIFYEAYLNKKDAKNAEKYFKSGHGREVLKDKLKNYFGDVA